MSRCLTGWEASRFSLGKYCWWTMLCESSEETSNAYGCPDHGQCVDNLFRASCGLSGIEHKFFCVKSCQHFQCTAAVNNEGSACLICLTSGLDHVCAQNNKYIRQYAAIVAVL